MKCTNCGKQVPKAAKVCGYCGHQLKAVAAAEPIPVRTAEVKPADKPIRKNVRPFAGAIFLALVFLWAATFSLHILPRSLSSLLALVFGAVTVLGYWRADRRGLSVAFLLYSVGLYIVASLYSQGIVTDLPDGTEFIFVFAAPVLVLWALVDAIVASARRTELFNENRSA